MTVNSRKLVIVEHVKKHAGQQNTRTYVCVCVYFVLFIYIIDFVTLTGTEESKYLCNIEWVDKFTQNINN